MERTYISYFSQKNEYFLFFFLNFILFLNRVFPKYCVSQTFYKSSHGILSRTPVLTEEETRLTKVSDLAQLTEGLRAVIGFNLGLFESFHYSTLTQTMCVLKNTGFTESR